MFELSTSPCQIDAVGDMDVFAASALRRMLGQQSVLGIDVIRVDLSRVTWINGSALRHVATTRRRMALLGVELDLVEWSAAVMRMSARARLDDALRA